MQWSLCFPECLKQRQLIEHSSKTNFVNNSIWTFNFMKATKILFWSTAIATDLQLNKYANRAFDGRNIYMSWNSQ